MDARYTGPQKVSPIILASRTGGLPLVERECIVSICGNIVSRQPDNGIGIQKFKTGAVASTQSARQYKDAADIVCEQKE